ncbi:MAG: FkbM family methyltransferase [Desulfopila sp.]|jgi:FkbM family methyltransferase|nr:FkbM family methyltransferase [Desulfopila sp.]
MLKTLRRRLVGRDWNTATKKDLLYCYRLLLGRKPDKEGWHTFIADVSKGGISIQRLVRCFISSPEFRSNEIARSLYQSRPEKINIEGYQMYVAPPDSAIGKFIIENREWEPHVSRAMRDLLKPAMVFLDIGANIGYFSLLAASKVGPEGKVISFEPDQFNCSLIHMSARENGFNNIDIYPFAAAEKKKNLIYDSIDGNGTVSNYDLNISDLAGRTVVCAVTVDDMLKDEERIDIMKIDIEGAEFIALQGAKKTISRHKPIIFSEFCPAGLENISHASAREYLEELHLLGYQIAVLDRKGEVLHFGADIGEVIRFYQSQSHGHIDLLATPADRQIV